MTQHGAYSIVLTIREGRQPELAALLAQIDAAVGTNALIPFKQLPSIHFARFVILDTGPDIRGNSIPARLVFTTNYDLPLSGHLASLVAVGGKGLWRVFSMCEDAPVGGYDAAILEEFLASHNKKAETFYVGVGYRSVQQIHDEDVLRNAINEFADANRLIFLGRPALVIRQQIIDFVHSRPELQWARVPETAASTGWSFRFYGKLILVILLFLLLSPLIVPFVIVWLLIMLGHEIAEKDDPDPVTKAHIRELVNRETQIVQAQFSAMGNVKPGKFRLATMLFLLRATDFMAPYLFSKGKLSGIPTVHFARWLIINEGRQMLFLSNYDGNSENYLRDFIHIAAKQLTLMFCHTQGYPRTRLMVFGGAKDAEGFMAWARYKQVITNVWYSANPEVSVMNVYQNNKIRNGLYGGMTEAEAKKWSSII
ncbi:MAG TPA: hypothetical protein VHW43_10270 [Puia sp.]|nr:hypothetical protein [Puia sp.]